MSPDQVFKISENLRESISSLTLNDVPIPFTASFDYSGPSLVNTLIFHKMHSLKPVRIIDDIRNRAHALLKLPLADFCYRFSGQNEHEIYSTIGVTQSFALDETGWWGVWKFIAPSFEIINELDKTISIRSHCTWMAFHRTLSGRSRETIHVLPDKLQRGLNRALLQLSGEKFNHKLLIDLQGVLPAPGIRFAHATSDLSSIDIGSITDCKIEMILEGIGACDGILFCPKIGLLQNIKMENPGPSEKWTKSFLITVDTSSLRPEQSEIAFYFISNSSRKDLRFQSHKVFFKSRYLILDPEIVIYDAKNMRFIPETVRISCSDDSKVSTTATVHSNIRSKIKVEKISENTFRLVPCEELLKSNSSEGIEIMTILVEDSNSTLNRNLRVIVSK